MQGITSTLKLNTKADFANNYQARLENGEADPLKDYRFIFDNRKNWFPVMDTVETPQTEDVETPQLDAETGEPILDPLTSEPLMTITQVPVLDEITNEPIILTTQVPRTVAAIVAEDGTITPAEDAVIDDEHKVTYDQQNNVFVQYELLVDNVGSLMTLRGFTEAELEGILGL